jgi:hypothetical protein
LAIRIAASTAAMLRMPRTTQSGSCRTRASSTVEEAIEAMTDEAFAVLADRPRYLHDGPARLQTHLQQCPNHTDAVVTPDDLAVTSANAEKMTAAQWAVVQEIQTLVPEATVTLRVQKLAWKRELQMALPPVFGVLVTQRVGPFTLRREYSAPGE